ncbi:SsnA protein [Olavius algarvensis spirochete endosymbiont]|uniref:putative aminohydrolase SsnA n=1 Tax=Olavius algarvensis spirochete endosymbiont TaxID=260710 RepID=UPI000F1A9EAD|nr:putative aminohydrolase SsnA [Olavius algarvensis spirochete endosymbiont]VDA99925.1 SsnA protein [Olavius algarvensis spirochete endosymbiont]
MKFKKTSRNNAIVIKGVCAIEFDPPRIRENMDVLIEGNRIASLTQSTARKYEDCELIDGRGKIVFPGIVCSHHHIYSALSRGILVPIGPTNDFVSILKNLWWRLDRAIDRDTLHFSTLVASMDAIRCGTTAIIDHHASPSFIEGSLDVIKRGMEFVGVRGATCYEVTDRHGREEMHAGIEENRRFALDIEQEKNAGAHLVEAHVGGHAPCTLPEEAYERMGGVIRETGRGLHLHVAEDRYDVSQSHIVYGEDIVRRLDRHGLLDEKTILVHGVHLIEEEVDLLNERDSFLVHNVRSNMNNNVGYNRLLPRLRNLALGTDGIGADMFAELQTAYFKHKDDGGPWWPGEFLAGLQAGNRILERCFGARFGRLESGYMADLVVAQYNPPTPLSAENLAGHFVFGLSSGIVQTVIVNGCVVLRDGKFSAEIDDEEIAAGARKQADLLWKRMEEIVP